MSLRQWLTHLRQWVLSFPFPKHDEHLWSALVFSGKYECLVCGATFYDPDDDDPEAEKAFYEKHPELDDV